MFNKSINDRCIDRGGWTCRWGEDSWINLQNYLLYLNQKERKIMGKH